MILYSDEYEVNLLIYVVLFGNENRYVDLDLHSFTNFDKSHQQFLAQPLFYQNT